MNMLFVLPYCQKDVALAAKLLDWITELKGASRVTHSCLLVADAAVPKAAALKMQDVARSIWYRAETMLVTVPETMQAWPQAPNLMFQNACRQINNCHKLPWLWLEPDAVPLKPTWMDDLANEYANCPKRYVGAFVESSQANTPPVHLPGVSMYPPDAYRELEPFTTSGQAFDMAMASHVIPRANNTLIIQSFYGTQELAPSFKETKAEGDAQNVLPINFIKPNAVLFHRCKDGSLIDVLRARRTKK